MDTELFSDPEWQDVLDEFRILVSRAGYADWDAAAIEALDDEAEDGDGLRDERVRYVPPVEQLRRYARAFSLFLKVRSRDAQELRRVQLGNILRTADGAPVENVVVDFDGREQSVFAGEGDPDAMIAEIGRLLAELDGEDGAFWNDDADDRGDDD